MFSRLLSQYTAGSNLRRLVWTACVEPYFAWFWHFYQEALSAESPPQVAAFRHDWPEILQTVCT